MNPFTIQLAIAALAAAAPHPVGQLLFEVVFTASMLIFFLVSTGVLLRGTPARPGPRVS